MLWEHEPWAGVSTAQFFEFSQTFTGVSITRQKHEEHVFYFLKKIPRRKIENSLFILKSFNLKKCHNLLKNHDLFSAVSTFYYQDVYSLSRAIIVSTAGVVRSFFRVFVYIYHALSASSIANAVLYLATLLAIYKHYIVSVKELSADNFCIMSFQLTLCLK